MTVVYKDKTYPSKNEIVKIEGGIATLRNVRQDMVFTVSEEDLPDVLMYSWFFGSHGYVSGYCKDLSRRKGGHIALHQFLCGYPEDGFTIDHINRIRSDNTRTNLRVVTFRDNIINSKQHYDAESLFLGVTRVKSGWSANITIEKTYHLGTFSSEELAALCYDNAVLNFIGEATTNFSLGLFSREFLNNRHIDSLNDIKGLSFRKKLVVGRFFGVSFSIGRKCYVARLQGSGLKERKFFGFSERIVTIRRELFLDQNPVYLSKRNDLLSLFIPQPGQKFIIPRYVNDGGEVVDCPL